jgi:hypothetical protein
MEHEAAVELALAEEQPIPKFNSIYIPPTKESREQWMRDHQSKLDGEIAASNEKHTEELEVVLADLDSKRAEMLRRAKKATSKERREIKARGSEQAARDTAEINRIERQLFKAQVGFEEAQESRRLHLRSCAQSVARGVIQHLLEGVHNECEIKPLIGKAEGEIVEAQGRLDVVSERMRAVQGDLRELEEGISRCVEREEEWRKTFMSCAVRIEGGGECFMTRCSVRSLHSSGLVACHDSLAVLTHCSVSRCGGHGIFAHHGGMVALGDTILSHNGGYGVVSSRAGGTTLCGTPDVAIRGCTVTLNGKGGVYCGLSGRITCIKTGLSSNKWEGATAQSEGELTLIKCEVSLNGKAGVAITGGGKARLDETELTSNAGEGLCCKGGKSNAKIHGGLIRKNGGQGLLVGDAGDVNIDGGARVLENGNVEVGQGGAARVEGPKSLLTSTDCFIGHASSNLLYDVECIDGGKARMVNREIDDRRMDYAEEKRVWDGGAATYGAATHINRR